MIDRDRLVQRNASRQLDGVAGFRLLECTCELAGTCCRIGCILIVIISGAVGFLQCLRRAQADAQIYGETAVSVTGFVDCISLRILVGIVGKVVVVILSAFGSQ